jgi:hypothetical protein
MVELALVELGMVTVAKLEMFAVTETKLVAKNVMMATPQTMMAVVQLA